MCRSIKPLRDETTTDDDVRAAALQFVRKVSGYRVPSKANANAFETAVDKNDFELNWNAPLPKGGNAIGEEVKLTVHLEMRRKEE